MPLDRVIKRDGTVVPFDRTRIESAIYAAARAVGNGVGRPWAETLSWAVAGLVEERYGNNGHLPHVEDVQDAVEEVLIKSGSPRVAKAYILYRQQRAEARDTQRMILDAEKLVDDYLRRADWRVVHCAFTRGVRDRGVAEARQCGDRDGRHQAGSGTLGAGVRQRGDAAGGALGLPQNQVRALHRSAARAQSCSSQGLREGGLSAGRSDNEGARSSGDGAQPGAVSARST